ncbi:hypothetical protein [Paenibacillus silvisoli]|uniref:hypothetical protein n=1 Tax=Paenibacillus silvisoli TaxID=3110539 RepID=UPI002803EF91|nr:hypothetical protein [Paenibacillus silvisoli]
MLERFHLNHRVAFSDADPTEIAMLEEQLAALGAHCVLLTISPEAAKERIQSRTPAEWAGKSDEEIEQACRELLLTQERLREQARSSKVPTTEINTDRKQWDELARELLEGWCGHDGK